MITHTYHAICFILFIYGITRPHNFAGVVYRWFYNSPDIIRKPLFDCLFCMSWFWGSIYYLLFVYLFPLPEFLQFIISTGAILYVIDMLVTAISLEGDDEYEPEP